MISNFGGINALADFKKAALLKKLRKQDNDIQNISAQYIHFVEASKLSQSEEKALAQILTYGSKFNQKPKGQLLLVVPRLGSISPWSSKATDIAHNCGLDKVERIERGTAYYIVANGRVDARKIAPLLHDRMTETILTKLEDARALFKQGRPKPAREVDIKTGGQTALERANRKWGMALSQPDIDYLFKAYKKLRRNPTDAELMMFAQINSEHCRHKIFNADWTIDSEVQPKSLFKMIKNTYEKNRDGILSAYSDNAAVLEGSAGEIFFADPKDNIYKKHKEPSHIVVKVETHNHPTAVAPFPGAATGSGGEIRDEGATGRGSKPKIALTGFSVSNLNLPDVPQPWEKNYGKPSRISSPLEIMIDGPLGGAASNNEFGRPNLAGYFRTYEQEFDGEVWGYHKPIMIAGGLGAIRDQYVQKRRLPVRAKIITLGGPAMLIGLGGGSGASMQAGASQEDLDFASVQRSNAELQRRAQEVITTCYSMQKSNPILTIHDVGAGGWSNALPELVHDSGRGAKLELRSLPNAEPGLSPMEIWCNEAQERYVLGIAAKDMAKFEKVCRRERCPFAVLGQTTKDERLVVHDAHFDADFINLPMSALFGESSKMSRAFNRIQNQHQKLDLSKIKPADAAKRLLQLPAVSNKKFLITIGDRTVGGLSVRDQMVGPWQVPVSDVAVCATAFEDTKGEAMAMGERTPLAIINAPASARMAIGEAITNIASASIAKLSDVKLSANWMAAAGHGNEDQNLYETVKAVGEDFCPALGLTIPVGKDSLSMRTIWQENGQEKSVVSPLSLIISAFAPVQNTAKTLTPELQKNVDSTLILIDLGAGQNRLGGSALAQVYNQVGDETPDADAKLLKKFFSIIQELNNQNKILAYHDRSDGGLFATLCEMAFASRCGLRIDLGNLPDAPPAFSTQTSRSASRAHPAGAAFAHENAGGANLQKRNLEKLFNEELGAIVQVATKDLKKVVNELQKSLGPNVYEIGKISKNQNIVFNNKNRVVYKNTRAQLEQWWSSTSYHIQSLRDNPKCAKQEFDAIADERDLGITPKITFKNSRKNYTTKPKVAILREQGVNGQVEMAAAFDVAGFTSVDVHLNDLMLGTASLKGFTGMAVCGGFSYGDVLGAGEGWAKSILFNQKLHAEFGEFFNRPNTFSLGVCNGCQMLAALKELVPGAENWPRFLKNSSEQFEARLVSVKINKSPSILLQGMEGSTLPVPTAHGEGRAKFQNSQTMQKALDQNLVCAQFVDNFGNTTEQYPLNPNGSKLGITALTTLDGRVTILMPHPERVFLTKQFSWHPKDWGEQSPWLRMFQNARQWV